MEYYDEIIELLNKLNTEDSLSDGKFEELRNYFLNEIGKEVYLIFSEWAVLLSNNFSFKLFKKTIGLIVILINKLRESSPLISQELIDLIYMIVNNFTPEEYLEIQNFLFNEKIENPNYAYCIFISLFVQEVKEEYISIITNFLLGDKESVTVEIANKFSKLPLAYKLAISRCALKNPKKFELLSLERLSMMLMNSGKPFLQNDGIKLASIISNASVPRDLFISIICSGPYLSTLEEAKSAWETAKRILNEMSNEDRFYSFQKALESNELPEAAETVLIHELLNNIRRNKNSIFRSPLMGSILLPLVLKPSNLSSIIGKTELVLTVLNFLQYVLLLDKRTHCFVIFGNESQMKNIGKLLEFTKKSISQAKKDNKKPKEKILEDMKKVNFGENLTLKDIDTIVKSSSLSISRIEFVVNLINDVIDK